MWPQNISVRDMLLKSNVSRHEFCQMVKNFQIPPPLKVNGKWVYPPIVGGFVLKILRGESIHGEGGE